MSAPSARLLALVVTVSLAVPACGSYVRRTEVTPAPSATPADVVTPPPASTAIPTESAPTLPTPSSPTPAPVPSPTATTGPDLSAYAGLGTWIDIYDNADVFGPSAFGGPEGAAQAMVANGVRTVFLEAGSYRHPPVTFPGATRRFIRAAHAAGLKVIAWYLPKFANVQHDLAETMRVIGFRTADGQGYDGFALDIEAALVPPERRIANFLRLSARIRAAVGPDYALGAIIPSPRGLVRVPTYWPGFPYAELPKYYDVILPMSYFTFHEEGPDAVGQYVRDNVEIVRGATGRPDMPVHVIGGIADDMDAAETQAFVDAALQERVFGASLYEFARTSPEEWSLLAPLR